MKYGITKTLNSTSGVARGQWGRSCPPRMARKKISVGGKPGNGSALLNIIVIEVGLWKGMKMDMDRVWKVFYVIMRIMDVMV